MTEKCNIRISRDQHNLIMHHLFPGDGDEHGAVLLAGFAEIKGTMTFYVREIHLAKEGKDYVEGKIGYRALAPTFIHKLITRARDEKLAYLAIHNHASDDYVDFSHVDYESHVRGYPALSQISRGMPVGALVYGQRSIEADVWLANGQRLKLDEATIVGSTIERLTSSPRRVTIEGASYYERQIRMFGKQGQTELTKCRVAIVGLGGIGSLIAEILARLGVGHFCLVDDDAVEDSNLSRIAGAYITDAEGGLKKVNVATRNILLANPNAQIQAITNDASKQSAANEIASCDYIFLAADSMRARLTINALVHQYLIPGVQLGAKIRSDKTGRLLDIMSANRPLRPGQGCLWCNQLIDANILAKEAKTDEERKAQAYGVEEPNPSVITLNAIAAAHASNDFLLDYLGLRSEPPLLHYEEFHFLRRDRRLVQPRLDNDCPECSPIGLRYARAGGISLPCIDG